MRLLLVGTAPETGQLAQSLVLSGSGRIVHCGMESEAVQLVRSGARFDWVMAEVDAAPTLTQQLDTWAPPAPAITFLDWTRDTAGSDGVPAASGSRPAGLVNDGESPWVLEYHVPRSRGSMA
jgi:hypothetical protein